MAGNRRFEDIGFLKRLETEKIREMARNCGFEISSSSPDGSNFPSGQRRHFSSASNLERSSSFGEKLESPILTAEANLSEVLLLDALSMGDEKYPELIRATNAEDPSLGSVQAEPLSSLGVEELKQVRTSVTENSLKARERINFLNEAISKLDKYGSPMLERKKRSGTKLSAPNPFSVDASDLGGNFLKLGPQNHTASNWADLASQILDEVEGHPNNLPRLSVMTDSLERDRLRSRNTASQSEDKDWTLPTESESWEKTKMEGRRSGMKSDVSINAVTNSLLDGDRDYKWAIQQRPNAKSCSRLSKGRGFNGSEIGGDKPKKEVHTLETDVEGSVGGEEDSENTKDAEHTILQGKLRVSLRSSGLAAKPTTSLKEQVLSADSEDTEENMEGEVKTDKKEVTVDVEVEDDGQSNFPELNLQGEETDNSEKMKEETGKRNKGSKKTKKGKGIEDLNNRMMELEKKFMILARFTSKVMHRSATTLAVLQDIELKDYEEMYQFLIDDWGQLFNQP